MRMRTAADRTAEQASSRGPAAEAGETASAPAVNLERLLRLVSALFGVRTAILVRSGPHGLAVQALAAKAAFDLSATLAVAGRVIASRQVICLGGCREDLGKVAGMGLDANRGGFEAAAPVINAEGLCLGALCLTDSRPRAGLSSAEEDLLSKLGALLSSFVRLRPDSAVRHPETVSLCPSPPPHVPSDASAPAVSAIPVPDANLTEARFDVADQLLFVSSPFPMFVFDRQSLAFVAANQAAQSFYGYDLATILAMTLPDLHPEHARGDALAMVGENIDPFERSWTHVDAEGKILVVSVWLRPVTQLGKAAVLATVVDGTKRHRVERDLRRTRAFLDCVVESIPVAVFVKDMQDGGRYVLYNRAGEELIGRPRQSILGRTDEEVFDAPDASRFAAQDRNVLEKGDLHLIEEETFRRGDGEMRTVTTRKLPVSIERDGPRRYLLGISEDITERRLNETRITYMAHHDVLTDLANRVLFRERLDSALARAARYGDQLAVLCIDLDNFKGVNDALGHPVGDGLLRAVGERLRQALRNTDSAARLGGDEFAVLQVPVRSPEDVVALATRLMETLSAPVEVEGHRLIVGASIGIALGPSDDADPDLLLKCADIALYRAKSDGRGQFRFFEPAMNDRIQVRRALDIALRRALAGGELELRYQPLVDIASGIVKGCEALLRWRHPERGVLLPGDFLPLAEEIGLMVPMGTWVLRQACAHAAHWPDTVRLSVNVSPSQFKHRGFVESVLSALASSGLAAHRLDLEITESVLLSDHDVHFAILHKLHAIGVRVSIDDFGTGYSALNYLRAFPFSNIKIDRSFIRELGTSHECLAIIRAVSGIGASLGVTTIAEGVETFEQVEQLRAQGCREAQGFLFSEPMSAEAIREGLLARHAFHLESNGPEGRAL